MQIIFNENNIITVFVKSYNVPNGWDFFGEFPLDILPRKYMWISSETETNNYICHLIDGEETDKQYGNFAINPDYENEILLPQTKDSKINELDITCTQTIYSGTDVQLTDGTVEHFTLDDQDQANLLGLGLELISGATTITWHTDDKHESCKFYSAADGQKIIGTLTIFKSYHITYFRDLRIYVDKLTSIADISSISYGYPLPEEDKSEALKAIEKQMGMRE